LASKYALMTKVNLSQTTLYKLCKYILDGKTIMVDIFDMIGHKFESAIYIFFNI